MALTGKPTVVEPRAAGAAEPVPSLRPTQSAIASIRERLRLIDIEVNRLAAQSAASAGDAASIEQLRNQITSLRVRVQALETESPTHWYVNGSLVGINYRVDLVAESGIAIVGTVDPVTDRVVISFKPVVGIEVTPRGLVLTGAPVEMALLTICGASALVLSGQNIEL